MIVATIFLVVFVAGIAKMVYDVQQFKKVKVEAERLQYLAGIEVPELDTPITLGAEVNEVETEPSTGIKSFNE